MKLAWNDNDNRYDKSNDNKRNDNDNDHDAANHEEKIGREASAWPGGGGVLPNMGYIGMCGPKG